MSTAGADPRDRDIAGRKQAHIDICVEPQYAVETGSADFSGIRFIHRALPEIDADEVDTGVDFLGYRLSQPWFISSMTGGSAQSYGVNKELARAAQEARVAVGMGSIRILLRKPEVMEHFRLKEIARDVPVFANIGGVQLPQIDLQQLLDLIGELGVDALAVHLNPGQELLQPEGDRDFRHVLAGLEQLCAESPVPIIAKETGFGISPSDARALLEVGVWGINVAGTGGTNWMRIEAYRASEADLRVADEFNDWGLPTAVLLEAIRRSEPRLFREGRLIASGGIRTGMDVAKSIALGAQLAGSALPFIRAVKAGGAEAVLAELGHVQRVLATAMSLTGSLNIADLQAAPLWRLASFDAAVSALLESDVRT